MGLVFLTYGINIPLMVYVIWLVTDAEGHDMFMFAKVSHAVCQLREP